MRKAWPFVLLAVFAFFGTDAIPDADSFIAGTDVRKYFFWIEHFIKSELAGGTLPLWSPHFYGGQPLVANPQTFLFYPTTLLFAALPLPVAFTLDTTLHMFLGGLGMLFFVRGVTQSPAAGVVSALAFMLNGLYIGNLALGHQTVLHSTALVPWIFHCGRLFVLGTRWRFCLLTGAVLGLQLLSGDPQTCLYTGIFLVPYLLWVWAAEDRDLRDLLHRIGPGLLLVPVLGLCIAAAQALPSLELTSLSDRTSTGFNFAAQFSFPPPNFYTLIVPHPPLKSVGFMHELGCYSGITTLILALCAPVFSRPVRHWAPFAALLVLAATFMLGGFTPLYRIYYTVIPGLSMFRVPARALVMFVFFLSALSGAGCAAVRPPEGALRRAALFVVPGGIFAVALIPIGIAMGLPASYPGGIRATVFAVLTVIGGAFFLWKKPRLFAPWCALLLFIDLFGIYTPSIPVRSAAQLLTPLPYERTMADSVGRYRVAVPAWDLRAMGLGYMNINGYAPTASKGYYLLLHDLAGVNQHPYYRHMLNPDVIYADSKPIWRLLGVRYHVPHSAAKEEDFTLVETDPTPLAALVDKAVRRDGYEDTLNALADPGTDLEHEIILASDAPGLPGGADERPGKRDVRITRYDARRIELFAQCDRSLYLLLREQFYPGWEATVDGVEVPILRANWIQRAVILPPGDHTVVFSFNPGSVRAGIIVSISSVIALAGVCLWLRRRGRL